MCGWWAVERRSAEGRLGRTEVDLARAFAAEADLAVCQMPGAAVASLPAQAGKVSTAGSLATERDHGEQVVAGAEALGKVEEAPGEAG